MAPDPPALLWYLGPIADVTLSRLLILGAALLFSTGGAVIKATALSGWEVASFRSGIAALTLLIFMPAWRCWWEPRALAVGVAYAATLILYVLANKLTTAANAIFLQDTAPLYVLLLAPWLLGERTRKSDMVFTSLLIGGLLLFFVGVEPARTTAPDPERGNWLGLASGFSWALTLIGLRWLGRRDAIGASQSTGGAVVAGNVIAFVACLPLALPLGESQALDWLVVSYLGVFQIGLAYVLMTRGVRGTTALEISLLLLLEPVLNAVWAWLAHREQPGPWSLAGCAIVLLTTLGLTLQRRR
ncbi:DMT family transporter [bacterium]|nr:DMT family transporter [bacterium]